MSNFIQIAGRSIYNIVFRDYSISKGDMAVFPFVILALFIFCNLNGVLFSIVGINNLGSPLMLISAIAILTMVKVKISWINSYFISLMIFFASFLILGWASLLFNFGESYINVTGAIASTRVVVTAVIILAAFYFYAMHRSLEDGVDAAIFDVYVFFIITLLVGVFEEFLGIRNTLFLDADPNRALGFFGNPNETGFQANLTLTLSMLLFMRKRIGLIFFVLVSSICVYGVISSFSKTAIITLVIVLLCFVIYLLYNSFRVQSNLRFRSLSFLSIFFSGILFLSVYVIVPYVEDMTPGQIKRIESIGALVLEGKFNKETTSDRSGIFSNALQLIKEKPITGYGLFSFSKGGLFVASPTHGVHNLYLRFAGEGGVLLLIIFLSLLGLYFYQGLFKIYREVGFVFVIFIGCIALYSFASHNTLDKKFIMGLLGLFLCIVDGRFYKDDGLKRHDYL